MIKKLIIFVAVITTIISVFVIDVSAANFNSPPNDGNYEHIIVQMEYLNDRMQEITGYFCFSFSDYTDVFYTYYSSDGCYHLEFNNASKNSVVQYLWNSSTNSWDEYRTFKSNEISPCFV